MTVIIDFNRMTLTTFKVEMWMIDLMLENACEPAIGLDAKIIAMPIKPGDDDGLVTFDFTKQTRE